MFADRFDDRSQDSPHRARRNTEEVKILTLSHKTRQGWGTLGSGIRRG